VAPNAQAGRDWLLLVCVNLTVPVMIGWERHSGQVGAGIGAYSGLASVLLLNSVVVIAARARNKRIGQPAPEDLGLKAIVLATLSALSVLFAAYSIR
jgi:hypothetical protein